MRLCRLLLGSSYAQGEVAYTASSTNHTWTRSSWKGQHWQTDTTEVGSSISHSSVHLLLYAVSPGLLFAQHHRELCDMDLPSKP